MHPVASKPSSIKKPNHMLMNQQGGSKMMNSPYSGQQMIPQQGEYPPQQNSDQAMPPPPSYDAAMSQRMTNQKQPMISNFSPHHPQQFYNQQNSPAAAMMHSPAQQPSPYQQFAPQQSPMYSNSPKYQPISHQSPVHPQIQPSPHHIPPHMGMSPNPRNARVPGRPMSNQQPDQFDFSQSDHIEPIVATDPNHPSYFINKPQQMTGVNRLMQNDVQQIKNHQQSSMPVYGSMQHDNNKMKHFQNMNNNPATQKNNPHQVNTSQSQG